MIFAAGVWLSGSAWAGAAIGGVVTDQNGRPIANAQIRLSPGNVELVTTREGRWDISYLRDDDGERVKLAKRQEYRLEVIKLGFHTRTVPVSYKRGVLEVDAVMLVPETLHVDDMVADLSIEAAPTTAQGDSKEGQ